MQPIDAGRRSSSAWRSSSGRRPSGRACASALQRPPDPRRREVPLDPEKFQQAVLNLAINALEAMPAGGELVIEAAERRRHLLGRRARHRAGNPRRDPGRHLQALLLDQSPRDRHGPGPGRETGRPARGGIALPDGAGRAPRSSSTFPLTSSEERPGRP